MRKSIGWLWIVGFFGLLATANAQTPAPSTAGTQFDGTYALVSSVKVTQTYRTRGGQMGVCADRVAGPLTIAQGQAQYTTATGYQLAGPVGAQGQLAMRSLTPPGSNGYQPLDIIVSGNIDSTGTAHARQISNSCSYDFVWRKESK